MHIQAASLVPAAAPPGALSSQECPPPVIFIFLHPYHGQCLGEWGGKNSKGGGWRSVEEANSHVWV